MGWSRCWPGSWQPYCSPRWRCFRGPQLLAVDRTKGVVTRPGSWGGLIRNITVFSLQYGVAVANRHELEPDAAVAIIGHAVSGASAGYFSGWAAALLRRYRNFDNAGKQRSKLIHGYWARMGARSATCKS